MASVQDLETRLAVCEDKLDFIMKAWKITRRSTLAPDQTYSTTLLDLYKEFKALGGETVGYSEPANG